MKKEIKLKEPQISEWIFEDGISIGKKEDGLKPKNLKKFHISELTEAEATEYAERYKDKFLQTWKESKDRN